MAVRLVQIPAEKDLYRKAPHGLKCQDLEMQICTEQRPYRKASGLRRQSIVDAVSVFTPQGAGAGERVVDTLIGKIGEFTQGCRELKEDGIEGLIVASLDLTKLLKSTPNSFQTIREPPSSLPGWSKSKFDHCKLIADRFTDLDGELQRFLENLEYLAAKIEVFEYFKSTIELFQLGLRNRALYLRVDDNIPTDNRENLIFIHGLPITLGDEIKELNNAFGSLITSGLPAIKRKQNSENFRIRVVTTMATLFAGVTATTLQMSLSIPDSNPFMARVNMLWFWSLAFAIGAAMNGFLDQSRKLIMPDLTYGERRHWVRAWIGTSGPLFMAFSILCFSIGLVAFAYGSSQEKFTSDSTVFVTVFTYLPVITFAVYALWSWYTHVSSPAAPKRSSRKRIKIPEIDDIVCFDTLNIYGPVRDLEYSPDGSLLAVTYYNEDIKKSHTICYEADDELYDAIYQYAHAGRSTALAWSKDGCKFFVRFEDKIDIFSVSKKVRLLVLSFAGEKLEPLVKKGSPPDITCVRFKYRFIQSVVWCHPGDSSGSTTVADLLCAQGDSLYKLTTSPSSEPDSKGSPKMKLHTFHNLYLQNLAVVPGEPNLVLILAQVSTETKVLPNDNALRRVTTRISRKENVDVEGNTLARWRGELGDAARDAGKSEDDVEIIAPTKGRFVHQLAFQRVIWVNYAKYHHLMGRNSLCVASTKILHKFGTDYVRCTAGVQHRGPSQIVDLVTFSLKSTVPSRSNAARPFQ
ncbi:hypothetical protein D9615_006805 [Tricholomella constricta]|uniref:Uncharacterized protein n=1 Tax=Tricholomella constricta TaxID=117010 RepID=A0A8H5H778_9AGAR|nr:hypothetical protein D9615_006805 [Tricholomella constricta]